MDLAEFLLARISDDEEMAQRNLGSARHQRWALEESANGDDSFIVTLLRQMLADLEAKRRIVELHRRAYWHRNRVPVTYDGCAVCADGAFWDDVEGEIVAFVEAEEWPCATLRLLALPYVEHPDYRDEWRP